MGGSESSLVVDVDDEEAGAEVINAEAAFLLLPAVVVDSMSSVNGWFDQKEQ